MHALQLVKCSSKDLLVRAADGKQKETYKGNGQYKLSRCKTCTHIKQAIRFAALQLHGEWFRLKATVYCKTTKAVYLTECKRCVIQYVGERRMLSTYA